MMDRFVQQLHQEWSELVEISDRTVATWGRCHLALRGCRTLDDVLAAISRDPDGCLYALLSLVRAGDQCAGRTVVQTMVPKMICQARRDAQAEVADYVTQLWVRIQTYPLERRPQSIAANLALDTLKAVKAEQNRHEEPCSEGAHRELADLATTAALRDSLDHNADIADLTARQVIGAAVNLGLIDEPTHQVLCTVYADGLSGREAAVRLGTTVDLVRWRCSKAVRRLASHAEVIALAA